MLSSLSLMVVGISASSACIDLTPARFPNRLSPPQPLEQPGRPVQREPQNVMVVFVAFLLKLRSSWTTRVAATRLEHLGLINC